MTPPLPGLRAERELRGLSQAELARLAGCCRQTIYSCEAVNSGHRVSLEIVWRIAAALNVSVETLKGETMTEIFARRRDEVARMLLGYRAIHYVGRGGRKKKEVHCGDSVG